MKLLHIVATPRGEKSNSLPISKSLISNLKTKFPEMEIQEINTFLLDYPKSKNGTVDTKYDILTGKGVSPEHKSEWGKAEKLITDFLSADYYVLTVPMWNFTIPYALKSYIDCIIQPGYLFQYNEQGIPEGLIFGKKMFCICTTGGDYSANSPTSSLNFVQPYLQGIFGFIGIHDIEFINVGPMDYTPELKAMVTEQAIQTANSMVAAI